MPLCVVFGLRIPICCDTPHSLKVKITLRLKKYHNNLQ